MDHSYSHLSEFFEFENIDDSDKDETYVPSLYSSETNDIETDHSGDISDHSGQLDIVVDGEFEIPILVQSDELINDTVSTADNDISQRKKLTRRRKRDKSNWERNKVKKRREEGRPYVNKKGIQMRERKLQKSCGSSCKRSCGIFIGETERKGIHEYFWKMMESEKLAFYGFYTERVEKARQRTKKSNSRRTHTYHYFLPLNGQRIQVCKIFFLSTLDVSDRRIIYYHTTLKNKETGIHRPKKAGKHVKTSTSEYRLQEVRAHINLYPRVYSHYRRSDTKREYLEEGLSISTMYNDYKGNVARPVSYNVFRKVFNTEFNLSFVKPKKDRCDICEYFKNNSNLLPKEQEKYAKHEQMKLVSREERKKDRTIADTSANRETCVMCFDLENIITLPKAGISGFFYKRKLNYYNLTAHCSLDSKVYCALWHEGASGRVGNHIASGLVKILTKIVVQYPSIKYFILWSDSCTPQNRNSIMTYALKYFMLLHPQIEKIEQKFSTPGHSNIQEVDTAHSILERWMCAAEYFSPVSLLRIFNNRNRKKKFVFMQMNKEDFKDFHCISSNYLYNEVPFTKVQHILLKKEDLNVCFYKKDFNAKFESASIRRTSSRIQPSNKNKNNRKSGEINAIPIVPVIRSSTLTKDKIKDIKSMLMFMGKDDKIFYINLFKNKNMQY